MLAWFADVPLLRSVESIRGSGPGRTRTRCAARRPAPVRPAPAVTPCRADALSCLTRPPTACYDPHVPVECAILIGLPGAGKTTFYHAHLSGTHTLVSKDLFPNAANRQQRMLREIAAALETGHSVAVDNTNPSRGDRAPIIELARRCGARVVAYHVRATTREAVARNEGRTGRGRVPKVAIFTVAKRLEPPALDEGFDAMCDVLPKAGGAFDVTDSSARDGAPGDTR